jgi:methylase of polypeptide subunit release factors
MAGKQRKSRAITEYGDFQTPMALARAAVEVLKGPGRRYDLILEPTCGKGAFVAAAASAFPGATVIGVDINPAHLAIARTLCETESAPLGSVDCRQGDFFAFDWDALLRRHGGKRLILGNPPWVTAAELGSITSRNLPVRTNFHGRAGIEAVTGKSNFDISEWMLLRYLDWLRGTAGTIAVLCKTAVARKILLHIWTTRYPISAARLYRIDALARFGAAVDACFFVVETGPNEKVVACDIFDDLGSSLPERTIGFCDGHVIADVDAFTTHRDLLGPDDHYVWRSGIKHDCARIMELTPAGDRYVNGLGERVALEDHCLFPLLKSSDIANGRMLCRGVMLVTQRFVGEPTTSIRDTAPATWDYLLAHADHFARRGSRIYLNKPDFSIFGVGAYSFAPWKIAISGLYKSLGFLRLGPVAGKPIVLDDTVNFLPCTSEQEARFLEALLNSDPARAFYRSMIHWDEKRPVTIDILRRLSLRKLAAQLGQAEAYAHFTVPSGRASG